MKRKDVVIGMKVVLKKEYIEDSDKSIFYTFHGEAYPAPELDLLEDVFIVGDWDEGDDFTFIDVDCNYNSIFSCECVEPYKGDK